MLLTLCTFLQSLYQPTNALNKIQQTTNHIIQFMASIKLLHVSAPECRVWYCHELYYTICILLYFTGCIWWLM